MNINKRKEADFKVLQKSYKIPLLYNNLYKLSIFILLHFLVFSNGGLLRFMKTGNKFYIQLTRELFTNTYHNLSTNAKWLFVVLNELEHKFTGNKEDFFTRSDTQLAEDTGFSLATLKRAKAELKKTDLIQTWKCHFINEDGKKSKLYYTAYRILK